MMKEEENVIWVQELGLGLNRTMSKKHFSDMRTFERMCCLHLSLGEKHGIYVKDAMIDTDTFIIDDTMIFDEQMWLVSMTLFITLL